MEQAKENIVAMTDDDGFVTADWLEMMTDRLRRKPGPIVIGHVELAGDDEASFSTVLSTLPKVHTKPRLKIQPFVDENAGMTMEMIRRIGPFERQLSLVVAAEDTDDGYRALRPGIPIAYDPAALVYHYHWRAITGATRRVDQSDMPTTPAARAPSMASTSAAAMCWC